MDRQTIYPGQIPLETDLLNTNRNILIAIGALGSTLFGSSTAVNGMACAATVPPSMSVKIAAGEVYEVENVDDSAYSSLAADTTHQTVKQGIMQDAVTLACPAPTTTGYSVNYLVQVTFAEVDDDAVVLPYYNSSDPTSAYSGPANSSAAQPTARRGTAVVTVKAGVAAATGTQTTPGADIGNIGLWVVTVAFGATTLTSTNISAVSGANVVPTGGILTALRAALAYVNRAQSAAGSSTADNTAPGTYTLTAPAWATRADVQIVGGGGGGGGSGTGFSGGGGGAGGFLSGIINVTPGATLTAIVGAGGAGSTGNTAGSAGGGSSITGIGSASGGGGGVGNTTAPAGGAGGNAAGTGLRGFTGGYGGDGSPTNSSAPGGNGAAGPFGGQGRSGAGGGLPGVAPGAGGGGAWSATGSGGAGAPGAVLVRWLP